MIHTIHLIKFFYPFIILAVFFCLYMKESSFNQRFYCCMPMYFHARSLLAFLTVGMLIYMSRCCYVTHPTYEAFLAAVTTSWIITSALVLVLDLKGAFSDAAGEERHLPLG